MSGLRVKEAGPGHSIQDHGRFGWRRFGISTAGAMDRMHLAIANRLVGNPPETAAIETLLSGCRLEVVGGPVLIAAAGPGLSLSIDGWPVPAGQSAEVSPGQMVALSPVRAGVYGYLAAAGGFALPPRHGKPVEPPPIRPWTASLAGRYDPAGSLPADIARTAAPCAGP